MDFKTYKGEFDMICLHTFVVLSYKESPFLEECLNSVLHQSYKSNVIIATTTDNDHIRNLAERYNLDVVVGKHTNIGGDFDFARLASDSPLVTIAHQDDIYDYRYAENIVNLYGKYGDASILFTDYFEIRNGKKEDQNKNLKIKRLLLSPLKIRFLSRFKFFKRLSISLGNSICCPSVTFANKSCPETVFTCNLDSNCDWYAWEKLSKLKGRFVYIPRPLMGHRIDETSTTTEIINSGKRTREDYEMFKKFWPDFIAKKITAIYRQSEQSNNV